MRISDWSSDVCSSDLEESENSDLAAAEERCRALQLRFGEQVGLVHGRMKGPAKDAAMARFSAGAIAVLVATPVVEVGVDVPEATVMVIQTPERFGPAQLHQLRGRVGPGSVNGADSLPVGTECSRTGKSRCAA